MVRPLDAGYLGIRLFHKYRSQILPYLVVGSDSQEHLALKFVLEQLLELLELLANPGRWKQRVQRLTGDVAVGTKQLKLLTHHLCQPILRPLRCRHLQYLLLEVLFWSTMGVFFSFLDPTRNICVDFSQTLPFSTNILASK